VKKGIVAVALVLLVAAGVATVLSGGGGEGGVSRLVVVTMPGVSDDVAMLLDGCNVTVVTLVEPGVDPHTYNLEPSKASLLEEADLIVSTGHTAVEERLRELVEPGKMLVIPELEGIRIVYVEGSPNLHGVQYDPGNLRIFLVEAAGRLSTLYPDCSGVIEERLAAALDRIDTLVAAYGGALEGETVVVSDPAGVYALEWLGPSLYLVSPGHDVPATPGRVEEARKLLAEGAIAAVLYAGGSPATPAGEWLLSEAEAHGARVIRVPAPYTPGTTLEKLDAVARQAVGEGYG